MKITLGIPCHVKDLPYLSDLLWAYQSAKVKPDEIVVSICGSEGSPIKDRTTLKIVSHKEVIPHGPNRQIVYQESSGDVVLYQDADDIPHPERLKYVKECFSSKDVAVLSHFWIPTAYEFKGVCNVDSMVKVDKLAWFPNNRIEDITGKGGYGSNYGPVHGGNIAVSREVFSLVRWKDWDEIVSKAEDCEFCFEALFAIDKSYVLPYPLIKYRKDGVVDSFRKNHPDF